jgi:hypothetical protein
MRAGLSEAEADEAVQDTIIGVARKLPDYRYDSTRCSSKTWPPSPHQRTKREREVAADPTESPVVR